jgi:hypothetical protein
VPGRIGGAGGGRRPRGHPPTSFEVARRVALTPRRGDVGQGYPLHKASHEGNIWENGPPVEPNDFFPGVWLQDPRNTGRYNQAGINLYVGLWKGPTEAQFAAMKNAGMRVICGQNKVGPAHKDDKTVASSVLR